MRIHMEVHFDSGVLIDGKKSITLLGAKLCVESLRIPHDPRRYDVVHYIEPHPRPKVKHDMVTFVLHDSSTATTTIYETKLRDGRFVVYSPIKEY